MLKLNLSYSSEVMHFSFCFTIMVGIDIIRKHHNFLSNPGLLFLFLFSASGFQVQEGVQQLRGSPRCCGKCWPAALVASSPGTVPTALLPCQGRVCCAGGEQQEWARVLGCWKHGDAQEKPLVTRAGVFFTWYHRGKNKYLLQFHYL